MDSYHGRHSISIPLGKELEVKCTDNGVPHFLKASWALLLARLSETQTTTFAVLEQPVVPRDACSKLVASSSHLETWEISDNPDILLVDAAKEKHREPLSGTQTSTGVVIRWHDAPNSPTSVRRTRYMYSSQFTKRVPVAVCIQCNDCFGLQQINRSSILGIPKNISHSEPSLVTIDGYTSHFGTNGYDPRVITPGGGFPGLI